MKYLWFLVFATQFLAGQNLVNNPSFEEFTQCPTPNIFIGVTDWYVLPNHLGTPDYYNSCSTHPLSSVPTNLLGTQIPYYGDAYIGVWCYNSSTENLREYVQTELQSSLIAGQTYYISFYVSLIDVAKYAVNNIGAALTIDPLIGDNTLQNLNFIPQINSLEIISDKVNWTQISGVYQAIGGERFLTLGNFYTDEQTSKLYLDVPGEYNHSYYLIDNVTVSTSILSIEENQINEKSILYPNPFNSELIFELDDIQKIEIYSPSRLVRTINGNVKSIDVADLATGIYFIHINTENNRKFIKKVIKE